MAYAISVIPMQQRSLTIVEQLWLGFWMASRGCMNGAFGARTHFVTALTPPLSWYLTFPECLPAFAQSSF
uniref:Uncharacterized protein n=1 Tax=Picea glauca TaxID=3330 RepID=A0A101M4R3_PICGL|nr:hypothetical protein ABT39_MTgene770 [Picea glauca]